MSSALITGGTGFIGGAIADRLIHQGWQVSILARSSNIKNSKANVIKGDLSQPQDLQDVCRGHDVVVHCAAFVAPFGTYDEFYRANVEGTKALVDSALQYGCKKFVNFSTPSVYFDYSHRTQIKETDPLPSKQHTHYGATKLLADDIVREATTKGLATISLRPRAVFGVGDRSILPRIIRIGKSGRYPLIGDGKSLFDTTVIDNVVDATLAAIAAPPTANGKIYNITNGEPMPMETFVHMVFAKLKMNVRFQHVPYPLALTAATCLEGFYTLFKPGVEPPISRYTVGLSAYSQSLDISAARRDLGYSPKISVEQGLDAFCAQYKD